MTMQLLVPILLLGMSADVASPATRPAASATATQPSHDGRPSALLALEEFRSRLRKGRVAVSYRHSNSPAKSYVTYLFAGNDLATLRSVTAGVGIAESPVTKDGPEVWWGRLRLRSGLFWEYTGYTHAEQRLPRPNQDDVLDVRTIDLWTELTPNAGVHDALWRNRMERLAPVRFAQRREETLYVVTATNRLGKSAYEAEWWIDPARGWSPVRILRRENGKPTIEVRSLHRKFGDVWFPIEVKHFSFQANGTRQIHLEINVDEADFSGSAVPDRLGPNEIGADAGVEVTTDIPGNKSISVWDGQRLITQQEYAERLRAHQFVPGPRTKRVSEFRRKFKPIPADNGRRAFAEGEKSLSQWDAYVKAFAKQYDLSSDQVHSAEAVLADCKAKARDYMALHAPALQEEGNRLAQRENQIPTKQQARPAGKVLHATLELMGHVDDLFKNDLVPRLKGLLTAEQRKKE